MRCGKFRRILTGWIDHRSTVGWVMVLVLPRFYRYIAYHSRPVVLAHDQISIMRTPGNPEWSAKSTWFLRLDGRLLTHWWSIYSLITPFDHHHHRRRTKHAILKSSTVMKHRRIIVYSNRRGEFTTQCNTVGTCHRTKCRTSDRPGGAACSWCHNVKKGTSRSVLRYLPTCTLT